MENLYSGIPYKYYVLSGRTGTPHFATYRVITSIDRYYNFKIGDKVYMPDPPFFYILFDESELLRINRTGRYIVFESSPITAKEILSLNVYSKKYKKQYG